MKNRDLLHLKFQFTLIIISFTAGSLILIACTILSPTKILAPTSSLSPSQTNLPVMTYNGTNEILPTGTSIPISTKTPTVAPIFIPTTTPVKTITNASFSFQRQCIDIQENQPESTIPGALVLDSSKIGIYFLNLTDYTKHTFPITHGGHLVSMYSNVSPDGKWLAYLESFVDEHGHWNSLKLRLINADGQRKMLSYWIPDWQAINGWLDNETLLLSFPNRPPGAVTVLNVLSGQWYEFSPILPNIKILDYYDLFATVFYDPTLSFVVYSNTHKNVNLWDINSQKILWQKDADAFSPAWSPDGKQFVVSVNHRLLLINSNGSETLILDLANTGIPFTDWSDIRDLSWSKDGSTIAVWLGSPLRLAIVDMITKQVTDLCITGVYYPPSSLIWSPDGQHLAVSVSNDSWEFSSDVVIVSPFEGYAYRVAKDVTPIGWLIKP